MEQAIKMEVKIEKAEPRDENDPTPLRERVGESSPRASFEPDTSVSKCGWDSDPEDLVLPSARPPTPGSSLQTIAPKDEFKMDPDHVMLDAILNDFRNDDVRPTVKQEVCAPPPSCTPAPIPSSSLSCPPPPPTSLPPFNAVLDGLPSAYSARDNLEDMDLCSLGDEESDAELMAEKMELLRKLAKVNETDEEGSREHKKKKKSKKRKRSHRSSKQKEEEAESTKRPRSTSSPDESQKENKRSHRWPGRHIKAEKPDLDCVPVRADEKRLRVVKASNLLESRPPKIIPKTENLSKLDKRNLGVARAQLALELFQKKSNKEDQLEALMVDTMCKLPVHDSFRNQNGFENPSPLCNNMNVVYEFNSAPGTRIDLAKWGLEVLPQSIRELCRILGIDIRRLKALQKTATPSQHILKLKQEQLEQGVGSEEAEVDKATLYKNAGTQTDRKTSTHDAGVQARMEALPKDSTFWQQPGFNATDLAQMQSNVMYALQELTKEIPDAGMAETLYRRLGPALAITRHTLRHSN